jgi:hypothetical protein
VAHSEHHVPQPPPQPGLHGPPRRRRREIHFTRYLSVCLWEADRIVIPSTSDGRRRAG